MQFFGRPGNEVTNPYETLGVQRDASAAEIKKAFREKAPDMEAWIRAEEESIRRASRASNISEAKDDVRARFAGTLGMVSLVDPRDKTVKVRVMVSPGRAAEVWYPIEALWDARHMKKGAAVLICADELAIAKASRGSGIGVEKDAVRASCAGKPGTVLEVDTADQSCKVRVIVEPGQATICWFPIAATEPRVAGL